MFFILSRERAIILEKNATMPLPSSWFFVDNLVRKKLTTKPP